MTKINFNLNKLFDILKFIIESKFTGSIEIHLSQGGITRVIKHEVVK